MMRTRALTVTSTALGNEICAGDTPTFFANASIAGSNYIFRLNGVLLQNSTSQSFDPLAYGQAVENGDIIEIEASTGVASCSTAVVSLTIIENVISSAGTITTAAPTICSGETAPPLIGTDQTGQVSGTLSYQWQVSIDNNVTYADIAFATSQNYTPTTVLTSDTFFRRLTVSNTGTTTCEAPSNSTPDRYLPISYHLITSRLPSCAQMLSPYPKARSATLLYCSYHDTNSNSYCQHQCHE